jgi:hypothetical protein
MPLPRVYRVIQDSLGNVVPQVLCSVLNQGTGVLATLWHNDAGTIPLSNPMTSDATYGSFGFYVEPGHYDFTFTKPGYSFQPQMDVQVPQDDLTLGTMAQQNASAVAITGGQIVGLSALNVQGAVGINVAAGGYALHVDATVGGVRLIGPVGLGTLPDAVYLLKSGAGTIQMDGRLTMGAGSLFSVNNRLALRYPKDTEDCLVLVPTGSDAGGGSAILFRNVAGTIIGSISTNASATAYNTSSDERLKHAIATLTGALERVRALRPVAFRWNADDSPGVGFLAHELHGQMPEAVSGEPDAVHDDGSVKPQQVDHSKVVPYLVAAVQALLARVEILEAHLSALQAQLTP